MKKYKNYGILLVATILIFYVAWWILAQYKVYNDYQKNISSLEKLVAVVQPAELEPYIRENANFVMYVANTHVSKTAGFEVNLIKVVDQYNLKDRIVLYNVSEDPSKLTKNLDEWLLSNNKYKNIKAPALLYFDQGVLKDKLDLKDGNITQKKIYKLFKENELLDNE